MLDATNNFLSLFLCLFRFLFFFLNLVAKYSAVFEKLKVRSMKPVLKLYKPFKYQDTTANELYRKNHEKCKHFIWKKQEPNTIESIHILRTSFFHKQEPMKIILEIISEYLDL